MEVRNKGLVLQLLAIKKRSIPACFQTVASSILHKSVCVNQAFNLYVKNVIQNVTITISQSPRCHLLISWFLSNQQPNKTLNQQIIFDNCINHLIVSALTHFCWLCGCSVRDWGDWPVEKKCVFSVWSLAWEQTESGHHTTLWQPRADRGGNTHLPAQPRYLPCPSGPLTHPHTHSYSSYTCECIHDAHTYSHL